MIASTTNFNTFLTPDKSISDALDTSNDLLEIAGRKFRSRLMTGSGKYTNFEVMRQAIAIAGF